MHLTPYHTLSHRMTPRSVYCSALRIPVYPCASLCMPMHPYDPNLSSPAAFPADWFMAVPNNAVGARFVNALVSRMDGQCRNRCE